MKQPKLRLVRMPRDLKDPNALQINNPDQTDAEFRAKLRDLSTDADDDDAQDGDGGDGGDGKTDTLQTGVEKWRASIVAEIITEQLHYHFARDVGDALYVYEDGVYRPRGENRVKALAKKIVPGPLWSTHLANETIEYLRADASRLWETPPLNVLNLRNGLLDLKTRKLKPHTPEHLSAVQLPVNYDRKARCPAWRKQIADTFPKDTVKAGVPWEIVALAMLPLKSIQKALLLIGPGGTGKGTYLGGLLAFLGGRRNVAALSLQKIQNDRFAAARLIGKLANICGDLPTTHLETSDVFLKITGGDEIPGEHKFLTGFDFLPFVRLIFSANQPPVSKDATDAFFQRWYVIPLDRVYRGTKQEIRQDKLLAKLTGSRELSGVLNLALDVLPRVMRNGLTVTDSMRIAFNEFQGATDPLAVILSQKTIDKPDAYTACAALLEACNDELQAKGALSLSKTAFGLALKRLKPHLKEVRRTINGRPKTHCYQGIELKPERLSIRGSKYAK